MTVGEYANRPARPDRPLVLFAYPSQPVTIASTIEIAVSRLRMIYPSIEFRSWRDIPSHGREIFDALSSEFQRAALVVVDLTTLNANVAFELGLATGQRVNVVLIRDVTYEANGSGSYRALGFINSVGCLDFRNSDDLVKRLGALVHDCGSAPNEKAARPHHGGSGKVIMANGAFDTEGVRQACAATEAAGLEVSALSTTCADNSLRSLVSSIQEATGVIVHLADSKRRATLGLLDPGGTDVIEQNARSAFVGGVAAGAGVPLLVLQEGTNQPPVDFRRFVRTYNDPSDVPQLLELYLASLVDLTFASTERATGGRALLTLIAHADDIRSPRSAIEPSQFFSSITQDATISLQSLWNSICTPLVSGEPSYDYISRRVWDMTQFVPFVRSAAGRALSRNRDRISASDIKQTELSFSLETVDALGGALSRAGLPARHVLDALVGVDEVSPVAELLDLLKGAGIPDRDGVTALSVLFQEGAVGLWDSRSERCAFPLLDDCHQEVRKALDIRAHLALHGSVHSALRVSSVRPTSIWPPVWSAT